MLLPFPGKIQAKDDHGRPTLATKCQLRTPSANQVPSKEVALVPLERQESQMLWPVPCWDNHHGRTPSKTCSLPDGYTPFVQVCLGTDVRASQEERFRVDIRKSPFAEGVVQPGTVTVGSPPLEGVQDLARQSPLCL